MTRAYLSVFAAVSLAAIPVTAPAQAAKALYQLSSGSPLVRADDGSLIFRACGGPLRPSSCPIAAADQQWSYDSVRHRLVHVPTGTCLRAWMDASTAAHVALGRCSLSGTRWTRSNLPHYQVWTLESESVGRCLTSGLRRRGPIVEVNPRAALAPCNSSASQQFNTGP